MFGGSSAKLSVFYFVLISCDVLAFSTMVRSNTEVDCDRIQSQPQYSLSDMAGGWYGIEILEHVIKGRPTADSCIRVQLKDLDSNTVELIWTERNFEVIYKFVILSPGPRGNWTSQGPQRVSGRMNYDQFAGNVFVLKASEANIVLTFCSRPNILYSLVLSKKFNMNETELDSIHSMISRFGIPVPVDIKKYCKNRAIANADSAILSLVLCLISVFIVTLRGR